MKIGYRLRVEGYRLKAIALFFTFHFSLFTCIDAQAQQYNGTSGLIHIPSAEMNDAGDARIGAHYISKELMPDPFVCPIEEGGKETEKYNSYGYYLSITPFSWMEVAYTCVLYKYNEHDLHGYTAKDRRFALKLRPLKEGKYYPAVAIGTDDFIGSDLDAEKSQQHFGNCWISTTKHFDIKGHELGVVLGYRYYMKDYNKKYQGVNGALTYRPPFGERTKRIVQPRAIVEYDGYHVNIGADALFFRHILLQASLTNGKDFSGGIAYQVNLFYKNKKK